MPGILSLNIESPDCLPDVLREAARYYSRCADAERDECGSEAAGDDWEFAARVLQDAADELDDELN